MDPQGTQALDASEVKKAPGFDYQAIMASPAFRPGVVLLLGFILAFWSTVSTLPELWTSNEYYSHGFLVPLIAGYVLFRWWNGASPIVLPLGKAGMLFPRADREAGSLNLSKLTPRPSWLAGLLMIPILYVGWVSSINDIKLTGSFALLIALWLGIGFVGGWVWMYAMTMPVFFLTFALPVWTPVIDNYTNPLQVASAKVSFQMLKALGFQPFQESPTMVHLSNFQLDVGVPCSGLKLIIALSAFTLFFVMVGGLKWWGNLILVLTILPFAVLINGLRIALIGIVGDTYGPDAGHQFHDYSGYITLILCFLILFRFARLLGWKD
ncbi:MAG: exosortase/archaeosortase family protein [Fimbriimonas sp.]